MLQLQVYPWAKKKNWSGSFVLLWVYDWLKMQDLWVKTSIYDYFTHKSCIFSLVCSDSYVMCLASSFLLTWTTPVSTLAFICQPINWGGKLSIRISTNFIVSSLIQTFLLSQHLSQINSANLSLTKMMLVNYVS